MSLINKLLSFSLALACLSLRPCECSGFITYSQQCPEASSSPSDPYPHLSYDGTRASADKVLDGLNLQATLLLKERETPNAEVPSSNLDRVRALSKLFEVVRQRDVIQTMPEAERQAFAPVTGLLDGVATEMCELLQADLQGSFRAFDCSHPADIRDAVARLQLYDLVWNTERAVRLRAGTHENKHQCYYWNTRVLGNCTMGETPSAAAVTVQSSYLQPHFTMRSSCDCSDGSPLCQISS